MLDGVYISHDLNHTVLSLVRWILGSNSCQKETPVYETALISADRQSFSSDLLNSYNIPLTIPRSSAMEQPQNLRSLFAEAKAEKSALEARPDSNTDAYRSDVNATIAKLEKCQRLVGLLSLFSSNEPLEDISTTDIQYSYDIPS